jgi:hypothetical protein
VVVREGGPVYTDIDPVAVVPVHETDALCQALLNTIARGNATVPRPIGAWPAPVLLKHAGVRSWSEFARSAFLWSIEKENGSYQIVGYRKRPGGSWEQDDNHKIRLAPDATIDLVVHRMIAILQHAAQRRAARWWIDFVRFRHGEMTHLAASANATNRSEPAGTYRFGSASRSFRPT